MCGIFGQLDDGGTERRSLAAMARRLEHRGPDSAGLWTGEGIALGCRRLSIIDPAGGDQPLTNEDGSLVLVGNGEIYSHPSLRRRLEERGHRFRTGSDMEVILHLYEERGEAVVEALDGMFAFALWDAPRRRLLLARDRLGQKPLFLAREGGSLFFASEIKALLAVLRGPREMNEEALAHYLALRFVPPPSTLLRGIEAVPPAHLLVFEGSECRSRRYWRLDFEPKATGGEKELVESVRRRLVEAVESHLVSDVPVGAFLSGGVDSSLVVAVARRELGVALPTFAVGVEDAAWSELPVARRVADHLGLEHTEVVARPDLLLDLPRMVWHLDEPSDPIAPCLASAAALAAGHVKVVLGGDGGDELFAGFDRYWGFGKVGLYGRLPGILRRAVLGPLFGVLPESMAYKSVTQKLRWLHRLAAEEDPGRRYAEATTFFRFGAAERRDLFAGAVPTVDPEGVIAAAFHGAAASNDLDRMLGADYLTRLPGHSLLLVDRLGMAESLEQRSPLLDHRLVETLARLPAELKLRGRTLKWIGRRLLADYLPREIVERPKRGFMFPLAEWLRGELHGVVGRVLLDSHAVRSGLLRHGAVERLLGEHRRGRADHHVRLWMLLNLEIWQRVVLRGESPEAVREHLREVRSRC